jgi:hypothetical protein
MLTEAGQDQPAACISRRDAVAFSQLRNCSRHRLNGTEGDEMRVTDHEGSLSRRSDGLIFRRQEMCGWVGQVVGHVVEDTGGQLAGSQDVQPGQALSCSSRHPAQVFPHRRPFVEQLGFCQVQEPT